MLLNEFMTLQSLAKTLGVSKGTISKWRDSGLPAIKLGNAVLFHEPAGAEWLKGREKIAHGES